MTQKLEVRLNEVPGELAMYPSLFRLFEDQDPSALEEWMRLYREAKTSDILVDRRLALIEHIMSYDASIHLLHLSREIDHVKECLSCPIIFQLLILLTQNKRSYVLQIGILLSIFSFPSTSELDQRLSPSVSPVNFDVVLPDKPTYLCKDSESYLLNATANEATMLVNDCLLVKYDGILTALCVKTTKFPNGQMVLRGNWYSPQDLDLRQAISTAFYSRKTKMNFGKGHWVIMRAASNSSISPLSIDEFFMIIDKYIANLPEQGSNLIGGLPAALYEDIKSIST